MLDQEPSEAWAVVDLTKGYALLDTGSVLLSTASQGQRLQSRAMRLCLRRGLQKMVKVK